MQRDQYTDASVLLFDSRHNIRRQTRSILNNIGFWAITDHDSLEATAQSLHSTRFDLVVLATDDPEDGVVPFVQSIRRGRIGMDPFVPIILTSWRAGARHVEGIVGSGADDLLMHPFSTAQLFERVRMLVRSRKPFVMTEDYFGPDRRKAANRPDNAAVVAVPNALQASVEGRDDVAPSRAAIEHCMRRLERVKIRNAARRIAWIAEDLNGKYGQDGFVGYMEKQLTVLNRSAEVYLRTLDGAGNHTLANLCQAVAKVATGLQGKALNKSGLELLEETALALKVASEIDEDASMTAAEISSAISSIEGSQDKDKGEDWQQPFMGRDVSSGSRSG